METGSKLEGTTENHTIWSAPLREISCEAQQTLTDYGLGPFVMGALA